MTNAPKTLALTINKMLSTRKDMEIPALLGDKSGTIKADKNGNVYVTFWNGETIIVRNQSVPNQRHWVIVGYKNNILQVLRSWDVFHDASFPDVPEHDHTWGKSTNPSWVRKEQFLDGLAMPGTGLTVDFYGYWFTLSGVHHVIANQTIDLSTEIPTSGAEWCNVEADEDSVITFNAGTNKATKELLLPEDIPATAADKRLLFSVKVYYGQTEFVKSLTENDFFDPRFAGGGGGASYTPPATTAANDFQVGDGSGSWITKTLAQVVTILRTALDSVYAAISHTHAAGDIVSGTLDASRLPALSFIFPFGVYINLNDHSTTAYPYLSTVDFGLTPIRLTHSYVPIGTNDATNYWNIKIYTYDGATTTLISAMDTQSGTSSNWNKMSTTTFDVSTIPSSNIIMYIELSKTGTPGNLRFGHPVFEVKKT